MKLSQSTVAGIINCLCDKGFIDRKNHESDSRKGMIVLTDNGRELNRQLDEIGEKTEKLLCAGMSAEETAELNRLVQIALSNMNKQRYQDGK